MKMGPFKVQKNNITWHLWFLFWLWTVSNLLCNSYTATRPWVWLPEKTSPRKFFINKILLQRGTASDYVIMRIGRRRFNFWQNVETILILPCFTKPGHSAARIEPVDQGFSSGNAPQSSLRTLRALWLAILNLKHASSRFVATKTFRYFFFVKRDELFNIIDLFY